MPTPRKLDVVAALEQPGALAEFHVKPPEAAEDRQHRHQVEMAKLAHQQRKDLIAVVAFLGFLGVVTVAALVLVFRPGTAPELRTAAWSALSSIAVGTLAYFKGKGDA
jgi:hypothetical protein